VPVPDGPPPVFCWRILRRVGRRESSLGEVSAEEEVEVGRERDQRSLRAEEEARREVRESRATSRYFGSELVSWVEMRLRAGLRIVVGMGVLQLEMRTARSWTAFTWTNSSGRERALWEMVA
jgi:hypothetical protein